MYTVYLRYCWQRNHQIYGHIRCIYTVLANPTYNLHINQEKGASACLDSVDQRPVSIVSGVQFFAEHNRPAIVMEFSHE